MIICNGKIVPMEGEIIENGFLAWENGKITAVGSMENLPRGEYFDAQGGWVLPGLVDAHTHLGLFEDSLGFEGEDGNEDTDPVTPQLRVIDGINPLERSFAEARQAGVTCCAVSPGSCNPIAGQIAAVKTVGRRIDDMIVKAPCAMKFSLGENPKSCYNDKDEAPVTRMATAALIRETLHKAQEYAAQKQRAEEPGDAPEYDGKLEALLPVLDGRCQAHFHAHRTDDIFTALRIAKEFSLKPVILHGTEAHLVADILAEERVPICSGPFLTDRSKPELRHLTEQAPALLTQAGISAAIITDHPETPLKHMMRCAVAAVQAGMQPLDALRAITIVPARILGLDDRVGSLAVGKDADVLITSGDPLDYRTTVRAVFINGTLIKQEDCTL
ncbi:MAG TPA: amidohydrolase [Clostridiales bacterium]|nr:amidohydrolase [Clostridiales bacterium]